MQPCPALSYRGYQGPDLLQVLHIALSQSGDQQDLVNTEDCMPPKPRCKMEAQKIILLAGGELSNPSSEFTFKRGAYIFTNKLANREGMLDNDIIVMSY